MSEHLLSLESITKSYPETPVLTGVSLGISTGDRIGIIGRNGSGKSTLLRIVAGLEEPDGGRIVRSRGLRVAVLDQDPEFAPEATVADVLGDGREAIAMADRLGLVDAAAPVGSLSGGQRKRLALAVALATPSDILVLDEPTNHLDVDSIDWLEDHLAGRTGALLLVTHDRYLLDRVVNRVVEVYARRLHVHHGTYQRYLESRAAREDHEATVEHRRRQRLRTELAWLRRTPKARTSKSKARVKRVEELMATDRDEPRRALAIDLPARRIGSKVVNLHNAGKRYGGRWILRGITHKLHERARIGIVGPNGAGKTTFLRLIAGRIEPDEGKVTLGSTIHPGWYGQDPRTIPATTRLIHAVREQAETTRLASGIVISAMQLLERFQFPPDVHKAAVGDLSGGERRRLELLLTLMDAPNLLLLDEPTNDLDLDTLETLEEYLDAWPGALVVASHDRYFLDRVCDDIFSIEPDGSLRHHPGGWAAYRRERTAPGRPAAEPSRPRRRRRRRSTKLTYNDRRELDLLPERIAHLEAHRDRLLADLETHAADHAAATELGRRLDAVLADLDAAETRWLELTDLADRLD